MSEFEDRQDATPAIDTPAAATAVPAAADLPDDDLDAVAAVEGVAQLDEVESFAAPLPSWEPTHPEVSDEAIGPFLATDDDGPLLDDSLEDGIASVFAALHAAAHDGTDEHLDRSEDEDAADGITFRLLGELDRLWHRAA